LSRRIRNREEFVGIRLFHRQGPAGIPSSMRCS
jgi:DNA-binding transcriptional LysR family regulator